jgi:hypothetical protein
MAAAILRPSRRMTSTTIVRIKPKNASVTAVASIGTILSNLSIEEMFFKCSSFVKLFVPLMF